MRAYLELAVSGFRRYSAYPAATLAGIFTNSVFGLLRGYVLLALLAVHPQVGGYDARDALTYVWLTQGFIMIVYLWSWYDLALRITSGDIAIDLSRPIDIQGAWLAADLGRAVFHTITRGVAPLLIGMAIYRLRLPADPITWAGFLASTVLAVVVSFGIRFLASLPSFWLLDHRGVINAVSMVGTFLCGMMVPLSFLPDGLRAIVEALPFAAILQVPIDIFLGKHQADLGAALGFQAAWALALLAIGRLVLEAGARRVVVQGG